MSEDVNPLAPAEDAIQEEAAPLPPWAAKPEAARTQPAEAEEGDQGAQEPEAAADEPAAQTDVLEAPAPSSQPESPRPHEQAGQRVFNQGT